MSSTNTPSLRAAKARHRRRVRRLKGYGQWDPWRPAEPVRAYIHQLMKTGLPAHRIASGSGAPMAVIRHVLYGTHDTPPARKLHTDYANMIMSYRPTLDDYPLGSTVDSTGSRRRLQALATLGWTIRALAAKSTVSNGQLMHVMQRPTTSVAVALAIRSLYNGLWNRAPHAEEVLPGTAKRARSIATKEGWGGPLAWDDDTIDDRKARPRRGRVDDNGAPDMAKVIRRLEGERLTLTAYENTAAVQHGIRIRGLSFEAVAELLDMEYDSVKRTWERVKERARAAGDKWPNSPQWTDSMLTTPTNVRRADVRRAA